MIKSEFLNQGPWFKRTYPIDWFQMFGHIACKYGHFVCIWSETNLLNRMKNWGRILKNYLRKGEYEIYPITEEDQIRILEWEIDDSSQKSFNLN